MKKITSVFSLLIILCAFVVEAGAGSKVNIKSMTDIIPLDPAVTTGVLDNGMTYYIRENRKPEKRAELQLVVKCGSVDEEDDQAGLAHFTEHMCFNGTKNFPKNELVSFLELTGMKFGADVNANTGFDRTYYMITIPLDSAGLLEKGFQVLEEWAHNVSFAEDELEKERGVIMEEWRVYRGAQSRIMKQHFPKWLYGSKFADRLPIGDTTVILNAPRERFLALYNDFYRPDLQAVIAVGDFDKDKIEKLIKEKFGKIKMPKNPRKREIHEIPMHKKTIVSIATDKELGESSIVLFFKHAMEKAGTYKQYRNGIKDQLMSMMLSLRMNEYTQEAEPPFRGAGGNNGEFIGGLGAFTISAVPMGENYKKAFDVAVGEAFRAKQHGFTESELKRAKTQLLRFIKMMHAEKDKTESANYAREYYAYFYQGNPAPGIEFEKNLYDQFVPEITLDEINALIKKVVKEESLVISLSAPEKEGSKIPTEKDLLSWYKAVSTKKFDAYVDKAAGGELFTQEVTPGKVVDTKEIKEIGVTEMTLSNGVKVVVKPTEFKNDQIIMTAYSNGGNSLVSDDDYISSSVASAIVNNSGISKFDNIELQKMLSDKIARVSPYISTYSEGFSRGSTTPEDMETLFQLVNLYFTAPRVDEKAYNSFVNKIKDQVTKAKVDPADAFSDTISTTMSDYHFRSRPWSEELMNEIDFKKSIKIYKDRFADASDFTFIFVGNIDMATFKPMIEKYIASLPSLKRNEKWVDTKVRYPKGKIEKTVYKGITDKSSVRLVFTGDFEMTDKNEFEFDAMMDVFSIIVREKIREEKSGTYGVGARGSVSRIPVSDYRIDIMFGTNPTRVEELYTELVNLIKKFKTELPDAINVKKVKEKMKRSYQKGMKKNTFWLRSLYNSYYHGNDPKEINDYMKFVENLTAEDIQKAAKKYFNFDNSAKFVLYPEKK